MIYETNYKKIMKLIPDLASFKIEDNRRSHLGGGYLDLCIDMVEITEDHIMFALSQYYDDGVADCDMILKAYPKMGMVEALTVQNSMGFQEVYFENEAGQKMVKTKLKAELNRWLRKWLGILKIQGHTLKEIA
ncbi:unnamed protein product [marine sediment metagenome]|uniref:DUF6908 domain-containing protein n=1 Tax=marine sediment metagenome TaxID=412755 RepID=X0ZKS6_9ZZZZ